MIRLPPVPVITGCTATGKTALALALARDYPIEVISADSRQVYRYMDIGTAKPGRAETAALPHHLIDIADPDGCFSAGSFAREAARLILEISARGAVPVIVGGTGLYIRALTGPFDYLPPAHPALRTVLSACEASSAGFLRRFLARLDPVSSKTIGAGDAVRTLRALEITILSGRRASVLRTGAGRRSGFTFRIARIEIPGAALRARISLRVNRMMEDGLEAEVGRLLAMGYGRGCAPGRTIGYREVLDSIDAGRSSEETTTAIVNGTWRFSRRQRNMLGRLPADLVSDGGDPASLGPALFEGWDRSFADGGTGSAEGS
ncbi:MAG TPA: tRNA (adenosine(37)-N6)-dimethylallyltransferase MiaA [Candidatus Fermentibacter daniensis]|nr:tRNA (adenosine(37)-N6)-dimethylallyltransferase MiaA [Candidatus Fermentibacter daniensis]HOR06697.1 tRNA (adenosine(37)-N6)-dimethylallyltransferase MiaA [Candidatus Fermentibacter daniensis]HPK50926.1 tRNA (adenosine(37)-N6)-dimethylallyltransferase MiaA [Candidatus Fermentibacter daniensis]HQH93190.1 tRNA (adenosine(37)-N6)-dimethylallyltransferase MiaA [Candidatus Fermentibacter daniensis]